MNYIEQRLGAPAGSRVRIVPDRILLTDGPGHAAAEAMLEQGKAPAEALRSRITVILDHDIPAGSFASAFIQKHLIDFARENGLAFLQSAGIAYELLKVRKDDIVVSCGEHGTILGAQGALWFRLSEAEMQALLEQGETELTVPETVNVRVEGRLPEGAERYDAALWMASQAARDGKAMALSDCTERGLTQDDRKVLCLLLSRAGAATAYFAEDAGEPAETFDLSSVQPVTVNPGSILDVVPLAETEVPVNACFIGGCAGGRIEELRLAASILKGRRIRRELRLLIGFVDNETYLQAVHEGLVDIFFDCGAQVTNPGCASCQTTSIGVVGDGEVLASTGCYNSIGCSGTEKSRIRIASAGSVARAALTGVLTGKEA
ncbi:MAG: hypothetical protein IJH75_03980 [Mogibacterium sp.]|nr:hypothetical protein [Mogibacterium sp.]